MVISDNVVKNDLCRENFPDTKEKHATIPLWFECYILYILYIF